MLQSLIKKAQGSLFTLLLLSLAIPINYAQASEQEVNVYSARKEQLIKPLLDEFSRDTGIKVNLITSKADALLQRLQSEGALSPADLLVTVDAGRLYRAKQAGVLQPINDENILNSVPKHLRDRDNDWIGLTTRARVIVYAKDRVDPQELSTYEALTDKKWHKRLCIRSSNNIYNQSLVASMIAQQGEQATQQWADALVKNFARKPKGGDRDQVMAVAAGQCDIAVINTYYLGKMLSGLDEGQKQAAEKVAIFWPNQQGRGAHVNVSGIALTKASKNKENALKLIEFMLSEPAQAWYAETNNEYPAVEDVEWSPTLKNWGEFKSDALNLTELGIYNAQAVKIMDRAGWR
ncbi:Fe(3+) ABC transporter substrate-binding protein [Thiomicrorhabdus sediminis]|uniref:Fe(3+) ABC transporter substrate-binding protein n=1 Tax=Thiomicrorhabdus sediminis TaxID=2580412 RepID=A0A4P9K315_9GAMM|nr:Fe(3+) ABC transporter substrate-binding protein [Thiomicrorhabdus sediminis]QCU89242.1 Fe(3+) ABC transporter substrate-binding protein [Thiomicrorhabdus sediminis]